MQVHIVAVLLTFLIDSGKSIENVLTTCSDSFMNKVNAGVDKCDAHREYWDCVFRSRNTDTTEAEMKALQATVNKEMFKKGLNCYVNVEDILSKIQKDRRNDFTEKIQRPMDSDTFQDNVLKTCSDSLSKNVKAGVDKCDAQREYWDCVFWGVNTDTNIITETEIEKLHNALNIYMLHKGLDCSINVNDILRNIQEERKNDFTTSRTIDSGPIKDNCLDLFAKNVSAGVPECDAIRGFWKCHFLDKKTDIRLTTETQIVTLQNEVNGKMFKQGLYCSINVKHILAEIQEERRNRFTGTTERPLDSDTFKDNVLTTCSDSLSNNVNAGVDKCDAQREYWDCVFWGKNKDTIITTETEIKALQDVVDEDMFKRGLDCYINVKHIFKKIQKERRNGFTKKSERPVDSDTIMVKCLDLLAKNFSAGVQKCDAIIGYNKCYFWGTDTDIKITTEAELQALQSKQDADMFKAGIYCSINVKDMLYSIRKERKNGFTGTTERQMDSEIIKANVISTCLASLTQSVNAGMNKCDALYGYWECYFWATNADTNTISEIEMQALQSEVDTEMLKEGAYQFCSINVMVSLAKIREERRSGFRRSTHRPMGSQSTRVHSITTCSESLGKSLNAGVDRCDAHRGYWECVFWGTSADTTFIIEPEIQALQGEVDGNMFKNGLDCLTDVKGILAKIREERKVGVTRTTQRPIGSEANKMNVFSTCLQLIAASISDGDYECDVIEKFWNCYFWGTYADTNIATEPEMEALQSQVYAEMSHQDLNCYINLPDIIETIREERIKGFTFWLKLPIGFNESTNLAECGKAIEIALAKDEQMTCDNFVSLMKCVIRVERPYNQPTELIFQTWDNFFKDQMKQYGISCGVNVRILIEEVARENEYKTAGASTKSTVASIFDPCFASARTISDCHTVRVKLEHEIGKSSCSIWRSTLKCFTRVTEVYRSDDNSVRNRLQSLVDSVEIDCTIDTDALVKEVRREQGFNSGTKLGINIVIFLTLALSVIFSLFLGVR